MTLPKFKVGKPEDLNKVLGSSVTTLPAERLRDAYNRAVASGSYQKEDIRFAFKLAADPYYRDLFKHYGSIKPVEEAGFFDDGLEPGALEASGDPDWLTTSFKKVLEGIKNAPAQGDKPYVALLTTGAFAPVHAGHIEIMEAAQDHLSKLGYSVVGGYIAPAHDDYVATKGDDADKWTSDARLKNLEEALEKHPWLDVDPWMCRYAQTDLNFTDVILRLEAYLKKHLPQDKKIEVAYVFGGDHAEHARTFLNKGMGVCVSNRAGFESSLAAMQTELAPAKDRVFFVKMPNKDYSSREIRVGNQPALETKMNASIQQKTEQDRSYLVRDDVNWAASVWAQKVKAEDVEKAKDNFRAGLESAFKKAFKQSSSPKDIKVAFLPWQSRAQEWLENFKKENPSIDGDVLDARDFLLGSRLGGIISKMPDGSVGSLPCVLPYLSPAQYSNIPVDQEMAFSRDIIDLNITFHEAIGGEVKLKDADLDFRKLMGFAGFTDDMKMVEVLKKHRDMMSFSLKK